MSGRRWRARLKFGELVALLALLTALMVLGVSLLIKSFYRHEGKGYYPFDVQRGKQIEQKKDRDLVQDR
ncbi:MAG: hypothetical protein ACT4OO_01020 [Nitrospiraceae bacterium]